MAHTASDHSKTKHMTVEQAKQDLAAARSQQRELRKKIESLRQYLRSQSIDPDPPRVDLTARNNAMYSRYLDGLSWAEIAAEFKLTKERVKQLCARVTVKKEREARRGGEW